MQHGPRIARLGVALLLGLTVLFASAGPAAALTGTTFTLDQETGGQPTRFTFATMTDPDASIDSMEIVFPDGFDLNKSRFDVVTLEGLKRVKNKPKGTAAGSGLSIDFDPAIAPNSSLRIQIYDVLTPIQGGTYPLKVKYSAETTGAAAQVFQRRDDSVKFKYATPSATEVISRWMDQQPAITGWNSIKALGMFFKPQLIVTSIPLFFFGWVTAISLVVFAFPLAIGGGLGIAFMKMSKVAPLRWIAAAYINVIRGTPLFLQIFVAFIGLRIAGLRTSDYITAVLVLAINSSAYLAEIFRAGIQSISKGQFEAASSLGMTYWQSMQYVIIPQTVKRVLPTMTSEFILLFKDTALLSAIGIFELMMYANNYVARVANLTPYVVSAGYYLVVTIPLISLVSRLEAQLAVSEHGQAPPDAKKPGRRGLFWRPVSAGPESDFQASVAVSETRWRP